MFKVEFAAPVGYQEPQRQPRPEEPSEDEPMHHVDTQNFFPFSGEGNRLDGKKKKIEKSDTNHVVKVNDKVKA